MKRTLVVEKKDGTFRNPTKEEIRESLELRRLRKQLEELEGLVREKSKQCKHTVVYDTIGFPFDVRTCLACGRHEMI